MMYTTANFCKGLIEAVKAYMVENGTKYLPLEFLASRSDYGSCDAAKAFYEHGFRFFFVKDDNLWLHVHYTNQGLDSHVEYIVDSERHPYPDHIHYCMLTADLIALVQIAYDTLGNRDFKGRVSESWFADDIDELEASYEARRNEV